MKCLTCDEDVERISMAEGDGWWIHTDSGKRVGMEPHPHDAGDGLPQQIPEPDEFVPPDSFGSGHVDVGIAVTPVPDRPTDTQMAAVAKATMIAGSVRHKTYEAIREAGPRGLTVAELHHRMGGHSAIKLNTLAPRFTGLKADGHIRDSGQRRGDPIAIVWVVT